MWMKVAIYLIQATSRFIYTACRSNKRNASKSLFEQIFVNFQNKQKIQIWCSIGMLFVRCHSNE